MKIIIPMAGRGSRLRPHTLTTPKPLLHIAGKPIVQRLVEDIVELYDGKVEEIAFVIGDFGAEVERELLALAERLGAKGHICHQDQPLGTAHAIWMAEKFMDGEVIIAFADTLFRANFKLDRERDGAIWVKRVDNPQQFGVVTLDEEGIIKELVEKPVEFVSDLAIIGIYYIRDGAALRSEIKYLLDNDLREKGEYQLTNALENMKSKGAKFMPGTVDDWMDCGNVAAMLDTNQKVLEYTVGKTESSIALNAIITNSVIIHPCYIGSGAKVVNSVIGPNVCISMYGEVTNSIISNSLLHMYANVKGAQMTNSMIGGWTLVEGSAKSYDISDFSKIKGNA